MPHSADLADSPHSSDCAAMRLTRSLLILFTISYPAFLTLFYLGTLENRMAYAYSHLFLTYSYGFARRSLYGTLFQSIPFISAHLALLIGYAQVLIATALTYLIFARHFLDTYRNKLLFCFIFGGCGLLPHLGLLYGYLDVPLYSLLIISVVIVYAASKHYAISLVLISAVTVIGLLVHEAYMFMFYPAVFILLFLQMKSTRSSKVAFLLHGLFVAGSFCLIILHGNASIDAATYFELAKARTNIQISDIVFGVMRGSFHAQFNDAKSFYLKPTTILFMAVSVLASSPYLMVLWNILSATLCETQPQDATRSRWIRRLIPVLLAMPLILILVGFDFMRWLSCACINASVFVAFQLCFAANRDQIRREIDKITQKDWFISAIFACAIIGPFGAVMGNRLTEKLFLLSSSIGLHWGWRP